MAQVGAVPAVLKDNAHLRNPAAKALLALFALAGSAAVVPIPANVNIIATASLCVYAGCWKSVKASPPEDRMTTKDALRFPVVGSAVLFGLFLAFKFLPAHLINILIAATFSLLGFFVITATIAPCFNVMLPKNLASREFKLPKFQIPFIMDKPLDDVISPAEIIAGAFSLAFCVWYFFKKHWLANNFLGLAFAIQGIENISLGSTVTGCVLLAGLFFYDIFWVFFTPVMVSVAKQFDGPIKLLFPRALEAGEGKRPFSMLGLGDIVIPGIFVALLLRYDILHSSRPKYFNSTFAGYVVGLGITILVMQVFQAAQPALLYIVPAILIFPAVHSLQQKQFKKVFAFTEGSQDEGAQQAGERDTVPLSNGQKPSIQSAQVPKQPKKTI